MTFSEFTLRRTASLAALAGLPFHSHETAEALTDKVPQRQLLKQAGVDDVRSHLLRTPEDWPAAMAAVGLPAVLSRPRAGSARTYAIADEAQARDALAAAFADAGSASPAPRFVAEELLRGRPSLPYGDYVSVESLCAGQRISHLAITGKLPLLAPFRESGLFWPSQLPAPEQTQILGLVSRALRALGVDFGLTHTEVKLTSDGPRIIEVNGRLGGWQNFQSRNACGVDLVRVVGQLALGSGGPPPRLRPDRVHFQYHCPAPTRPCRLEAAHGLREVRALPGISGYRSLCRPGDDLPGGVMTNPIGVIWGACEDHDEMMSLLEAALSVVSFQFRFEDGSGILPPAR